MNAAEFKGKVDFGIITIREDEMTAVLARFPHVIATVSGQREYNLRRLARDDPYIVAIVRSAGQGNGEAQQVANHLLDELAPRWLLVVGIAGGAPAFEHTLGDVVVSLAVADFAVGAALQGGAREYALQGWVNHPEARKHAANLPALQGLGEWNSPQSIAVARPALSASPRNRYGDAAWKKQVKQTIEHHLAQGREQPLVTAGSIACSDLLMKDAELLKMWLRIARQVIAVEMESAGVHRAAHDRQVPFLSIRGLSDVVGLRREPRWTEYACHSAAAFTRAFLLTRPIPPRAASADRLGDAPRAILPRGARTTAVQDPPGDPVVAMAERLFRSWLPALHHKQESGLPLDAAAQALFRSVAPILRPTPHWLDVIDHYFDDPTLPADLSKGEEYALRELRNLGLVSHDRESLFHPVRSRQVAPTAAGAIIVALRRRDATEPAVLVRELARDLAALDDAALDLLATVDTSGRIPDAEDTRTRALRNRGLVNQPEYFLASSDHATLTELGSYVLKHRRISAAPRAPHDPPAHDDLARRTREWASRRAVGDQVYTLLEREFRELARRLSTLQRRIDLDSQDGEAFADLLSYLSGDAASVQDPLMVRADALLRQLEHCLDPEQLRIAEELVAGTVATTQATHVRWERTAMTAWRGETLRQHERLIPFFPDTMGELLDRVYVEVYVEPYPDSPLSAVTTLFELLSNTSHAPATSPPPVGVDAEHARPRESGRWVIIGDPGSGKTTLARHVAWRLATDTGGPIPVYVSLPRLAGSGKHPFEEAEAELITAIGPGGKGLHDGLSRAAKYRGGVCLMLDGFDEVPPSSVASIGARIRSWAYELPFVAIAVLTRPIGYQTLEPVFRHARVLSLDASAQQELLKRWCDAAVAERTWRRLHERGSRLRMLISNPLMLTLVAVLANEQESLPLNRVQLYADAIDLLLRRGHCAERRGVKHRIAARRILGLLSYTLQQGPQETWSKSQLHDAIVTLSADDTQNRTLLAPWQSPEAFLDDVAQNSGLLGAHDGPRAPWRFLHRSLREFLVAETLSAKFAALASKGFSVEDAMARELAGIDRDSVGRWGEPLSLLCGLVPQPMGLLKTVRAVNPGLAWRAILNADTIDPFETVVFISGAEWQDHIERIARTWVATQEDDDLRRAKELLWLMIDPARTVKDLAVIYQTLEDIQLPPDREAFFSRAGKWPVHGAPRLDPIAMIAIPAGEFTMGLSHPGLACRWDLEPSRQVVEAFEISSTPITAQQYHRFELGQEAAEHGIASEQALEVPMTSVSWPEAYLFARWLGCHLPTEIQWEYACRAGTTTTFCSGDTEADLDRVGWFNNNSCGAVHPVGRKQPNQFGLYDMHGNVWEWCTDWSIPPGSRYDPDDRNDDHAGWRVLCGGSWFNEARRARSAERSKWPSNKGYGLIGFRIVRR